MEQAKVDAIMAFYLKQQGLMVKSWHGKKFICRRPVFRDRVFSHAQKEVQDRFRLAGEYARNVMADPGLKADYEVVAKEKGKSTRSFIIGDFLSSPSIEEIYLSGYDFDSGDCIVISTADDFKIVNIDVAISTTTRVPIEEGPAIRAQASPLHWLYTFTTFLSPGSHFRVDVTATDRAGNTTTRTEII